MGETWRVVGKEEERAAKTSRGENRRSQCYAMPGFSGNSRSQPVWMLRGLARRARILVAAATATTVVGWHHFASAEGHSRKARELTRAELAQYFDHTLLAPDATPADVEVLCIEAHRAGCCSVCVNGSMVPVAKKILDSLGSSVKVCAVVGFPLGAMHTKAKAFEAQVAIEAGAQEIDMVLPIGRLRAGRDNMRDMQYVMRDIAAVVAVCEEHGAVCKVILETGLLSEDDISRGVMIAGMAGAHFVKTCTGFSKGRATVEVVRQMATEARAFDGLQVKASGGVRDYPSALELIDAGADRIGASRTMDILEECDRTQGKERR